MTRHIETGLTMTDGNYRDMAPYYDLILQSGYYDYGAISDAILHTSPHRTILELGCGTGLVIEQLLKQAPLAHCVGIDITPEMLELARARLADMANVELVLGSVSDMPFTEQFDVVFSYGGVWYFSHVDGRPVLISHIVDLDELYISLRQAAARVASGGSLLIGEQPPHTNYSKPIGDDLIYSQQVTPTSAGFVKRYELSRHGEPLMVMNMPNRCVDAETIEGVITGMGFERRPSGDPDGLLHRFVRH